MWATKISSTKKSKLCIEDTRNFYKIYSNKKFQRKPKMQIEPMQKVGDHGFFGEDYKI